MAMTTPAMPATEGVFRAPTPEEKAERRQSDYGRIKNTLRNNRSLTLRHTGPYCFQKQVLHQPRIPQFPLVIHREPDQADLADNLSLIAANYWHSLLFTPEVELPKAVEEALIKVRYQRPISQ